MIIGIDPDISKSGIACLCDDKSMQMECLSFVDVMVYIRRFKDVIKCVYLEAGWLNKKSNWHSKSNISIASSIGRNVGENHATGKLLQQCIEAENVKVILVRPTTTKLNAEQFKRLTGITEITNQEKRDAALLVWGR